MVFDLDKVPPCEGWLADDILTGRVTIPECRRLLLQRSTSEELVNVIHHYIIEIYAEQHIEYIVKRSVLLAKYRRSDWEDWCRDYRVKLTWLQQFTQDVFPRIEPEEDSTGPALTQEELDRLQPAPILRYGDGYCWTLQPTPCEVDPVLLSQFPPECVQLILERLDAAEICEIIAACRSSPDIVELCRQALERSLRKGVREIISRALHLDRHLGAEYEVPPVVAPSYFLDKYEPAPGSCLFAFPSPTRPTQLEQDVASWRRAGGLREFHEYRAERFPPVEGPEQPLAEWYPHVDSDGELHSGWGEPEGWPGWGPQADS